MTRRFLFLQGPHGPFFRDLACALHRAGADTHRVLFNRGDRLFWRPDRNTSRFHGPLAHWPAHLADLIHSAGITDLVLYGDTRPVHLAAITAARDAGVTVHVFEEGYLRPWWITYERDGANARSPVMGLSLDRMAAALSRGGAAPVEAPEGWGTLYRHMAYGAAYHAGVLSGGPRLPSHRDTSVAREAWLHARRLALLPLRALIRRRATRALRRAAAPYHLVLLQLDHDASYRAHSPFPDTETFLDTVLHGFARGARPHHQLVFKAHPLEDDRLPIPAILARLTARHGLQGRVRHIPGGRLGPLLDGATSALTVNSTAAQQALWRGLPVRAFGRAVYGHPAFVSDQPLPEFFADPRRPDRSRYLAFRQFLLESSQLAGSFYARAGRRQLCRRLPDLMLAPHGPYAAALSPAEAAPQQSAVTFLQSR